MDTERAAEAFAALAQQTRLALVRRLMTHGASGLPAGAIAQAMDLPASTLSFHLTALERAGLLHATRHGRQVIYAVRIAGLRALLAFLTATCCGDRPELCGDLGRLLPDPDQEPRMTRTFTVLFLCAANSARSIMAEAILEKVGAGRFRAYSAGPAPAPHPLPEVIEKLTALGHDVSRLRSKSWDEFTGPDAPRLDLVIGLCDTLHGHACPDFGARAITGSWPLPDPAKFTGSPAERNTLMNELYASLRRRIELFTALPVAQLDRIAIKRRLNEIGDVVRT